MSIELSCNYVISIICVSFGLSRERRLVSVSLRPGGPLVRTFSPGPAPWSGPDVRLLLLGCPMMPMLLGIHLFSWNSWVLSMILEGDIYEQLIVAQTLIRE